MTKLSKPTGNTVPELDFKRIEFDEDEIAHARGVAAGNSNDAADAVELLGALGLLPHQEQTWYYPKQQEKEHG